MQPVQAIPSSYNEQLTVNKAGVILRSLKGSSVTCVRRPADGAVILVSAANVTIGGHRRWIHS